MRALLLVALLFFLAACATPGTEPNFRERQSLTIVNQTKVSLVILKEGVEIAKDLPSGNNFTFAFNNWLSHSAEVAFTAIARGPTPSGAAVYRFSVHSGREIHRSETWIVRDSDLRSHW